MNKVKRQSVMRIRISAPKKVMTCEMAVDTSLVTSVRTVETSLVARLTSSPVRRSL